MNIRAYILAEAVILMGCLAGSRQLHAQTTFTIPFSASQSFPAISFKIDSFGTLAEGGPLISSATFSFTSAPQMVWIPALGAFRAGSFPGSLTSVGQYSAAFGQGSIAIGQFSAAFGNSLASGQYAEAAGLGNNAAGYASFASGSYAAATGAESNASGLGTLASGQCAMAAGYSTIASGSFSFSAGLFTNANSYVSLVVGEYNTALSSTGATPSATGWVATDPLLELGNGTSSSAKSDALVVYKNGNASFPAAASTVTASAFVTTVASGDIPMYNGSN